VTSTRRQDWWVVAGATLCCGVLALLLSWATDHGQREISIHWLARPVTFLQPGWFMVLAIAPLFFAALHFSLTDVSRGQQWLAASVRSLLLLGLASCLARPVWTTESSKAALVVLVDVSDSVSDAQIEQASRHVAAIKAEKSADDKVFVISFAERPEVVASEAPIARHPQGGAGTDLQAALRLAYGVFPDGYLPRVQVLSDGNQTNGDFAAESARAKELGVIISWKALSEDRKKEIQIAEMSLPSDIREDAPFHVSAKILSTHEEEVTFFLRQGDFPNPLAPKQVVQLKEGVNWVKFKSIVKRAGFATYTLTMSAPKNDTKKENNRSALAAPVKGRPRILYVEGGAMRDPSSAGHFKRALEHEGMNVEVRGPRGVPTTAKALETYDLVVISDVPEHFMHTSQMVALEGYVRTLGGGLLVAGGQDSFGSGGYQGTRIEKMMPVRFDTETTREQPNVAIVLVVDRSGSMVGAKIEAAKESARATAEVLAASDLVGVIAFDSQPTTIVRLQRASNRLRISNDISRLTASGGTDIYPALSEAYQALQTSNAKVKHVILLSDGKALKREQLAALSRDMRASQITVSAVGIGDADRGLLHEIAEEGDGRLYMVEDIAALPRIFAKETIEAKRSALVEDQVTAHVVKQVDMIEGTGVKNAPTLSGYVSTKPKPTGEVILVSDHGEPLLARWRLGTGTAVAWTSDIKNRWGANWVLWANYPKFWGQVVRSSMRRKSYDSYDMIGSIEAGRARIEIDAIDESDQFVNELDTTLEILDPETSKATRSIPMSQTAAGRYTASFDVDRYGSYMLRAVHLRDGKRVAESLGAVALPYPPEYLGTRPNLETLHYAATVTGGAETPDPKAAFEPRGPPLVHNEEVWPWLLLFVAGLWVLDAYLKRVRLFGHRAIRF